MGTDMVTVGIDAADTELGRTVAALAAADPDVGAAVPVGPEGPALVDVLVLLAPGEGHDVAGTSVVGTDVDAARALLASTTASTVVVLSTAMVYGARPDTPVPLTEAAPVQPEPGAVYPAARAALERAVEEWRQERPGTTAAVLRPSVAVAPSAAPQWLERSVWHARSLRQVGRDRPAQFLHLYDLAQAVDLARRLRLDGAVNVAPDGWLSAREQLELVGAGRPPRITAPAAAAWTRVRWWVGLGSTPPDLAPYARYPWVVANDLLRSHGWQPEFTNEETFVVGHRPGWWSTLTPDQRQAVALGGSLAVVVGVAAGAAVALRRAG
ncbi:MAG: NAD-dependent epimerase/dehydratase family protein, partial [Actinomycetes bacterium]